MIPSLVSFCSFCHPANEAEFSFVVSSPAFLLHTMTVSTDRYRNSSYVQSCIVILNMSRVSNEQLACGPSIR